MTTHTRKLVLGGLCAVLALALVAVFIGVRAGGDAKTLTRVEDKVMPASTTSAFIAPSEKDWWSFIQQSAETGSGIRDISVPKGSTWVGFSEGPSADDTQMLTTFYAGFDTFKAAEKYVRETSFDSMWVRAHGAVVEFLPLSAEFEAEKYPAAVPSLDGVPSKAVWRINFTDHFATLEEVSKYKSVKAFFTATGLRGSEENPVVWTGTASSPKDPFKGGVENTSKVNPKQMKWEAGKSSTQKCNDGGTLCVESVPGLNLLAYSGALFVEKGGESFGQRPALAPKRSFKPGKKDATGFIQLAMLREAVRGNEVWPDGMVGFDFTLNDKGDDMNLYPVVLSGKD